jgi:hypothetical protein
MNVAELVKTLVVGDEVSYSTGPCDPTATAFVAAMEWYGQTVERVHLDNGVKLDCYGLGVRTLPGGYVPQLLDRFPAVSDSDPEWPMRLRSGQTVIVKGRILFRDTMTRQKVYRVAGGEVVLYGGRKFDSSGVEIMPAGLRAQPDYFPCRLLPPTLENRRAAEACELISALRCAELEKLPLETIREMIFRVQRAPVPASAPSPARGDIRGLIRYRLGGGLSGELDQPGLFAMFESLEFLRPHADRIRLWARGGIHGEGSAQPGDCYRTADWFVVRLSGREEIA